VSVLFSPKKEPTPIILWAIVRAEDSDSHSDSQENDSRPLIRSGVTRSLHRTTLRHYDRPARLGVRLIPHVVSVRIREVDQAAHFRKPEEEPGIGIRVEHEIADFSGSDIPGDSELQLHRNHVGDFKVSCQTSVGEAFVLKSIVELAEIILRRGVGHGDRRSATERLLELNIPMKIDELDYAPDLGVGAADRPIRSLFFISAIDSDHELSRMLDGVPSLCEETSQDQLAERVHQIMKISLPSTMVAVEIGMSLEIPPKSDLVLWSEIGQEVIRGVVVRPVASNLRVGFHLIVSLLGSRGIIGVSSFLVEKRTDTNNVLQ